MSFKITSLNVNGLNSPQKIHMLWKEARTQNCYIECIQETHFKAQHHWNLTHNPHAYFANAMSKKWGVAIIIIQTVAFKLISSQCDKDSRYIILTCEINNAIYTIINAYAPNTRHINFLNKLWKKVKSFCTGHIILCGDLNSISNHQMDISNTTNKWVFRTTLTNFAQSAKLFDVWRCHHFTERCIYRIQE